MSQSSDNNIADGDCTLLCQKDRQLRAIFETVLDAIAICDDRGKYLDVNSATCELLGIEKERILGRCIWEFAEPGLNFQTVWQEFKQPKKVRDRFQLVRSDGEYRIVEYAATANFLPHRHLLVMRDITDRKQAQTQVQELTRQLAQAQAQLQQAGIELANSATRAESDFLQPESEEKFRSIIENLNDLVYIINPDTTFSYVSPQFKEVTGYEPAQLLNDSFANLVHPEDLQICVSALHCSLQGEKQRGIEYRVLHSDGNYYWHSSNLSALETDGDRVVSCVGIARYIHDRKQAEIALAESNSRWHLATEAAGDGTWDWNLKTNQVIFSRQWKAMLGYAEDEIANALAEWESRVHPDDRTQCHEDFSKHLKGETAAYRNEHRLRCKNGTYKWVLARGQAIEWDKDGQPLRFVGTHCDISDRKTVELELEQFFTLALDLLCIADVSGYFRRLNPAWTTILGYDIKELEGQLFLDFVHPDDIASTLEVMSDLSKQTTNFQFINRYRAKDGTYRYIEWCSAPCGDLIYAAARDITDRKVAETLLQQSQKRYETLAEASPIGVFYTDKNACNQYVNHRSTEIMGLTREECLGNGWARNLHPEDCDRLFAEWEQSLKTNRSFHSEYRFLHPDGTVVWVIGQTLAVKNDRGDIDGFVGTLVDITDRKRQEQALQLIVEGTAAKIGEEFFKTCVQYLAQALEVSYAFIAEFVDSKKLNATTLAFWAVDEFGENFTYNLGRTHCENVYTQGDLCVYPNSVRDLFPQNDDLVALKAESYAGLPIVDAAGNRLGLLAVLDTKPMVHNLEIQSAILRIFAIRAGAEIERMQAEAAVRRSSIQLRLQSEELAATLRKLQTTQTQLIQAEKMSSLGQLVAGIAHEINNPVSFIYSNIQPANDYVSDLIELVHLYQVHYPSPPPAISEFTENIDLEYLIGDFSRLLESMKTGATRISDIVKSLRTFSRLDEATLKEIDIHENIDSTLAMLGNRLNGLAGKPEIKIAKNYGKLPLVRCYGGLLNQVFMNLLLNAIDAIEERRANGVQKEKLDYVGQIAISTSTLSENRVCISIQDNGCGMTDRVLEKIFNPFFTTKPVGKGTGMGLATSYQIVTENHQGDLQCFSRPGEGTLFTITLSVEALT